MLALKALHGALGITPEQAVDLHAKPFLVEHRLEFFHLLISGRKLSQEAIDFFLQLFGGGARPESPLQGDQAGEDFEAISRRRIGKLSPHGPPLWVELVVGPGQYE